MCYWISLMGFCYWRLIFNKIEVLAWFRLDFSPCLKKKVLGFLLDWDGNGEFFDPDKIVVGFCSIYYLISLVGFLFWWLISMKGRIFGFIYVDLCSNSIHGFRLYMCCWSTFYSFMLRVLLFVGFYWRPGVVWCLSFSSFCNCALLSSVWLVVCVDVFCFNVWVLFLWLSLVLFVDRKVVGHRQIDYSYQIF